MSRPGARILSALSLGIVLLLHASLASAATPTSKAFAQSRAAAEAKAKEWFFRFRVGHIDRSQLSSECNMGLTNNKVSQIANSLRPYGAPTTVSFMGTSPAGDATGYNFILQFKHGRVIEAIALDASGAIAGFDFQTFVETR